MNKLLLTVFAFILFVYSQGNAQETLSQELRMNAPRQGDVNTIIQLTEEKIANLNWLKTKEWSSFVKKLKSPEVLALSPLEFKRFFNQTSKTLPFSHFYLNMVQSSKVDTSTDAKPYFEWKALDNETALIIVRSFVADARAMMAIIQEIHPKNFKNLIIDLRNNTGGTADAAVVLGQYLSNEAIDGGVYLPRGWFLAHKDYPNAQEIQSFSFLKDLTGKGFMEMIAKGKGFRMLVPAHNRPIFQGKAFILVNSNTASTCEPLVALLKQRGKATIVGRKTNGAMLTGKYFPVSDDLKLFLPVADYLMADGTRLDQKGVEPDILLRSEEALDYTLENLIP